ncbi:hypothetical protein UY3_05825 [Chelonia mydas]|uniref:Uncharacterized protein n=1 Tax=Chelonia mydas TaxID=8469 RepID=M7BMS2_CHEMY|nr:hypothetical protein UY3_05825 [Chelonia mydas]
MDTTMLWTDMLPTSNAQRLLGLCFNIKRQINSAFDFIYHVTGQMTWQQQLHQQIQRWQKWEEDEEEEEDTNRLTLEDHFPKQPRTMQYHFWSLNQCGLVGKDHSATLR